MHSRAPKRHIKPERRHFALGCHKSKRNWTMPCVSRWGLRDAHRPQYSQERPHGRVRCLSELAAYSKGRQCAAKEFVPTSARTLAAPRQNCFVVSARMRSAPTRPSWALPLPNCACCSLAILGVAGEARRPRRRAKNNCVSSQNRAHAWREDISEGSNMYIRHKMPRVFASNPGTVQANQGSTRSAKTVYVYTSSPYNHAHHPWKKIDGTVWVGCLNRR
jgi:hypothetical protein